MRLEGYLLIQLEHIEAIEKRLWSAADTMRANSNYASNEYFLPVMGLVFLRHAYSRYLAVKDGIEANLPTRGDKTRALTKEDFSRQSAIFLRPNAQFDHFVALPDSEDRAKAIIKAMESIEIDYDNLRGVLPKSEYQELDNDVLGQLLRTLNPDELKKVSGDVFGRIYEYFLTQFADQKAHDGGEFFTPVSLISLIAHVLDPESSTVLDQACGSGGMFVQSARIVEEHGQNPTDRLTFRGLEKNATTIRLAKMNLAVHGLEGDIQKAITYYEDPHELVGKADFVMANPPFNVDEIDADKDVTRTRKDADEARQRAVGQLKQVRDFWRQAHWLTERFLEAELCDVEGLVKLVDHTEIEANDWSLTRKLCKGRLHKLPGITTWLC
ncbi:MAG: type I restriction-modification system subunit M [Methanosarcinales archaeon]|nr:type I restriction-modification system subunit M [Methanosarcinales archaeon]